MANTAEEVWQLLGELIEAQKETERKFQETERKFQETEQFLREQSQETERKIQETNRQIRNVNEQLGKLGNRLGEFAEWQVRPAAVRLFQERGISVHEVHPGASAQRGGDAIEIDLLVINETEAILIEVKSKLSQADVDEHLQRLAKFKQLMPTYRNFRALGAVAAMVTPPDVARYAYRKGLFVIAQSGDDLIILNDRQFQPKAW
jgi:hypothetical protein